MRVGLAQINPTVGDLKGNAALILEYYEEAVSRASDLAVFPELALPGYPPEDLLLKPAFIRDNQKALKELARHIGETAAIVGFVDSKGGKSFNAAAFLYQGRVRSVYHKRYLPNYGVFDEIRYFEPGPKFALWTHKGLRIGVTVCEDIWKGKESLEPLKRLKPQLVVNISASPYQAGKIRVREQIVRDAARWVGAPVLYDNLVGAQDELVFDGGSFVALPNGRVALHFPQFKTGLFHFDLEFKKKTLQIKSGSMPAPYLPGTEEIYQALSLGLKDYVTKNGFEKVAVGLSGGIDSGLVAALAAEALGAGGVVGVTMPSQFNLAETVADAIQLAKNLGIRLIEIPIKNLFETYLKVLKPTFEGLPSNVAEENLQARIRGNLMMALSNKFGWLVLTTGNKSEISTGYCTLYGDTAGGFAVIKDVLKTTVYDLARLINSKAGRDLIPETILTRPPTAELRANQKDEDSLGPYAELDPIIVDYVENNKSLQDLSAGRPGKEDYLKKIVSLIDKSEYKRRQAPPGIKITPRAFGRDHRMPITNRYQHK